MRIAIFTFLLWSLGPHVEGQRLPNVKILSRQQCGQSMVVTVEVANDSTMGHIYFPLWPEYPSGHTVHNLRIELKNNEKWRPLERGLDTRPVGFRDLDPGERFIDEVGLPLSVASSQSKLRVQMPFKLDLADSYRDAFGPAFTYAQLSALPSSHLLCPK